jgi:nitrate reductase gamma subunit
MILNIATYFSILIFLAVVLYRFIRIANMPAHLRWDLYPIPHEGFKKARYGGSYYEELDWWTKPRHVSRLSELSAMIPEIILLRGVWESNRGLWFWSWAFHFGLYLAIFMAALVTVTTIIGPASAVSLVLINVAALSAVVGYILGVIGSIGMISKRLADKKLKPFTTPASIFNLIFILLIFITGLSAISKIGLFAADQSGFIGQLQVYAAGLANFDSAAVHPAVVLHIAIILLFMAYMPFTHMAHFVLKWFTYHGIRWNDEPNKVGSALEKDIIRSLNYKPTWAAKHIKGDGKKTWVDIATEEVFKDDKK